MNRRMGPETETQKAFREFGDAWEKLRDIIYKEVEPILEQIRKTISFYIHEFYEELAKTLNK